MSTNKGVKPEDVKKLETRYEELNKEIESKESYLNKLKNDIVSREKILKLNEEELPKEYKRYEDEIKLRDKQIVSLKEALDTKTGGEELKEAEAYIEELKKLEIEKDLKINDLNKEKDEKDKQIIQMSEHIQALQEEIENFKNVEKDEKAERENKPEPDNTNAVEELNNKISDLEIQIKNLKETNIDLNKEKEDILNELNEIKLEKERENNNVNNVSVSLDRLAKEHEEEKLHSAALLKERSDLENKLNSMKTALQEIKDKFEAELAKKEKIINEHNVSDLLKKIKILEDNSKNQKKAVANMNREKMELEEIILKQEEKVNDLANKFAAIEKMHKEKNRELKENEQHILQLVDIIEDQKKTINNLKENNSQFEETNFNNEVAFLKNHVNNLRKDLELKDVKLNSLQVKYNIMSEELKKYKLYSGNNSGVNKHNNNSHLLSQEVENESNTNYTGKRTNSNKKPTGKHHSDLLPPINSNKDNIKKIKTPNSQMSNLTHNHEENDNNLEEITNMMKKILEDN